MEKLLEAINTTPIIDNHAHPLLIPSAQAKYPLLAITTEAHGNAMNATKSTLSHIRAVKQLAKVLDCAPTWHDVKKAIEIENAKSDDAWAKRCLEGIELVLVDDGLDGLDEVFDYSWHDRLTRSKCKRIVRIEKVAEDIIDGHLKQSLSPDDMYLTLLHDFEKAIQAAVLDPEVVGFKSVVCYRTGLNISEGPFTAAAMEPEFVDVISQHKREHKTRFKRLDGLLLNSYLVHKTASIIAKAQHKKPFQFHTGLGDNDITLTTSSPSHLQDFIRRYHTVPIVLLHASYPWTKEAGYLASVYENVYADIGEVFPFLSQQGQENVIREVLELCPSEKLLWSTDGHWFPETYLLAIIQVREALESVLSEYVYKQALSVDEAIKVVHDLLFTTSNNLYGLKLSQTRIEPTTYLPSPAQKESDLSVLTSFLMKHPTTKFIRLQYLDYTATLRLRVVPVKRALELLKKSPHLQIGITKASLGLLQNDTVIPGVSTSGAYSLEADLSSIRQGPSSQYASVQCDFLVNDNDDFGEASIFCPRSTLKRTIQDAKSMGLEFILGFEIEVVFMSYQTNGDPLIAGYKEAKSSAGHSWSSAHSLENNTDLLTGIYDSLSVAGIELEQFHPESATGQFEFVLPPLTPLDAVDTLIHAREIIRTVVSKHGMRATLHPKPFPMQCGTASHVHISICSPNGEQREVYEAFYAGILKYLRSIIAFTYSSPVSYDRMADGCWAGGRWVSWGTQNRETPLRKISGSHWEFKALDGLANVYLAMAAIIASGIAGVRDGLDLRILDCPGDPANLSVEERVALGIVEALPADLDEALKELERDNRGLLHHQVVTRYIDVKYAEIRLLEAMNPYEQHQWFFERY